MPTTKRVNKQAVKQYNKTYATRHKTKVKQVSENWRERNRERNTVAVVVQWQREGPPKVCATCGLTKALLEYRHWRTQRDGLDSMCSECRRKVEKEGYARRKALAQAKKVLADG
jgi:hypothetical protein